MGHSHQNPVSVEGLKEASTRARTSKLDVEFRFLAIV
jgi:hypothetical protein